MAPTGVSPCIVVGYDGSPSSCAALKLAVDRVGTGKIFLVHGYDAPADSGVASTTTPSCKRT